MATNTARTKNGSHGSTELESIGGWILERDGSSYHWTHTRTGVDVWMRRSMGRDQYGRDFKGYRAIVRSGRGEDGEFVEQLTAAGHLPSRADAYHVAKEWMIEHADGCPEGM